MACHSIVLRGKLSATGKLVLRGTQRKVPKEPRRRVLELAHEGHTSIVATKRGNVW